MCNILIFESGTVGYGGSFKCCHSIATILKEYGYSPYIISNYDSIYWKKLNHNGIVVKKLYSNNFLICLEKISKKMNRKFPYFSVIIDYFLYINIINNLKRFIFNKNIALVHTNTHFYSDFLVYKLAVACKLPVICHLRSMPRRSLTRQEKKLTGYKNSYFIAISRAVLKEWVRAGLPEYKIKIIYDGLSGIVDKSNDENYFLKNPSIIYLLFAGRLKKQKGVNILIDALKILKSENWKLSIVGNGPEMKKLKIMAIKKGLSEKITFYGFRENIRDFYRSHDILIVPSMKEEFGLVILEAMEFGVPVIGSDSGGIPEIIKNERDGLLFEPGNPVSLSASIKYLIKNPEKRVSIGLKGMEKVKRIFSENDFREKLIETYDDILN